MTMRTALAGLLLLTSSPLWAEGSGHQQNPYMMQQAMNGDKTAQMMMMMGGGMGGGGGGQGSQYESKREDMQKAIEQPAKEIAKRGQEEVKAFTTATEKAAAEAAKSFIASTAKDEKIDEKLAAQISAPPPSNAKMVKESTDELIGLTKVAADAQKGFIDAQQRLFLNAAPIEEAPVNNMSNRLGWTSHASNNGPAGLGGAAQARTPASDSGASDNSALDHSPGANGGAALPATRGFASGLIHNPPKGF